MLSTLSSASTLLGLAKDGYSGLQYLQKRLDGREPVDIYLAALKEAVAGRGPSRLQRHQTTLDINLDLCRDRLKGAAIDPTEMPVFAAELDQGFAQRVANILSQEDVLIGFDSHSQADEGLPLSIVHEAHQHFEKLLWAAFPESTLKQAIEELSRAYHQQQSTLNEIAAALDPAHETAKRLALLSARAVIQIQRRTLTLLGRPEYQLPSDLIARPELVDLHAKLTSDTASRRWILTSDAGVGKSTLLNELTHCLHEEGCLVLFVDARQLRSFTIERDFSDWLEAEQPFRDALDAAVQRSNGRLIVLIDQYDGLLDKQESRNLLSDLVRSSSTTVRWALACRVNSPLEQEAIDGLLTEGWSPLSLDRLTAEQTTAKLNEWGRPNPDAAIVDLCRTPIHLRAAEHMALSSETVSTAGAQGSILTPVVDLWIARLAHIGNNLQPSESREFLNCLLAWAWAAQAHPTGCFLPTRDEDRWRNLILSDGLAVIVQASNQLVFAHELIPALILATDLIFQGDAVEQIGQKLSAYRAHPVILQLVRAANRGDRIRLLEQALRTDRLLLQTQVALLQQVLPAVDITADQEVVQLVVRAVRESWPVCDLLLGVNTRRPPILTSDWARVFLQRGLLSIAPSDPTQPWRCQSFLKRVAPDCPDVVEQHFLTLRGEGVHFLHALEMLTLVPATIAAASIDDLCTVFREPSIGPVVWWTSHSLLQHLAHDPTWDAAFQLLDVMIEPVSASTDILAEPQPRVFDSLVAYRPLCETLLSDPTSEAAVHRLIDHDALRCLNIAEARLLSSVIPKSTHSHDPFWMRGTIDGYERQDSYDVVAQEVLDLIRDSLYRLIAAQPGEAERVLERYVLSPAVCLQRLALHSLARHETTFRKLARRVLRRITLWRRRGCRGELAELVRSTFPSLDRRSRHSLIQRIEAHPDLPRGLKDGDPLPYAQDVIYHREQAASQWIRDWLALLHDYLEPDQVDRLTNLVDNFGPAANLLPRDVERFMVEVDAQESKLAGEVATIEPAALIERIRSEPGPSALEQRLGDDTLAVQLARPLFEQVQRLWHILPAIYKIRPTIVESVYRYAADIQEPQVEIPWVELVSAAEQIVGHWAETKRHETQMTPSWHARLQITYGLQRALHSAAPELPPDARNSALGTLAQLTEEHILGNRVDAIDHPAIPEAIPNDALSISMGSTRWLAAYALATGALRMQKPEERPDPRHLALASAALRRWLPSRKRPLPLDLYTLGRLFPEIRQIDAGLGERIRLVGLTSDDSALLSASWRGFLAENYAVDLVSDCQEAVRRLIDLDAATPVLVEFEPRRLAIALVGQHLRSRRPSSESLATHALLHGSPALRANIPGAIASWMSHLDKGGNLDLAKWNIFYDLVRTRVGHPHQQPDQDPAKLSVELAHWVDLIKLKPTDLKCSDITELLQLATAYASVARTRGNTWEVLMNFMKVEVNREPAEIGRLYAALIHAQLNARTPGLVFENPPERSFLEAAVRQRAAWTELANAHHTYLGRSMDLYVDLFGIVLS